MAMRCGEVSGLAPCPAFSVWTSGPGGPRTSFSTCTGAGEHDETGDGSYLRFLGDGDVVGRIGFYRSVLEFERSRVSGQQTRSDLSASYMRREWERRAVVKEDSRSANDGVTLLPCLERVSRIRLSNEVEA